MNRFFLIISLIFSSFLLSSCSESMCIDAEDFGFVSVDISSRYSSEEVLGEKDKQVAPWRNTSFVANGRPIMMVVKDWKFKRYNGYRSSNTIDEISAWCPWYGTDEDDKILSAMNERLPRCVVNGNMCTSSSSLNVSNPPCLFTKGVGLYALLSTSDPNMNKSTMQLPTGLSFHLGDSHPEYSLYFLGEPAGGMLFNYEGQEGSNAQQMKDQYAGAKLYLKILDTHYDDNAGQYKVLIKSGIDYGNPGPIGRVLDQTKNILFGINSGDKYGVIKNLYTAILNNQSYQYSVKMVLVLYLILSGLGFLAGTIKATHTEFTMRVIKLSFMFAMINSEVSWNFFHDYLFVFFIEGVDEISGRFLGQNGNSSTSGLTFFDNMLELMLGMKTLAKLSSLLFTTWFGFIFIIVYIFLCIGYMWVMVNAVVLYLVALISIGIIITMAPIFFCFGLFDSTKSLFQNWIKQLISYTLQPIILIVGLSIAGLVIRHEIYTTLGFQVCKKTLFDMGDIFAASDAILGEGTIPAPTSFLYWWFPKGDPADFCKDGSRYANIPVPEDYIKPDGQHCEAYECFENRCLDMPFINPNDPFDVSKLEMIRGKGSITLLHSLIIFFLLMYLLHKYNSASQSISRIIAGTSGNLTDTSAAAGLATDSMRSATDRVTSRMAEKISMRMERAYNRGSKGFTKGIARLKAGENFFEQKDKKPPGRLRKALNTTARWVSGKAVFDAAASATKTAAKYGYSKIASSKAGYALASARNAIDSKMGLSSKVAAMSAIYKSGKHTALMGGIALGEGVYKAATSPIYRGVSVSLALSTVAKGGFKAAKFLAVHRLNGLEYLVKQGGIAGLRASKVGAGKLYDRVNSRIKANSSFGYENAMNLEALERAEKSTGVEFSKLKQRKDALKAVKLDRKEALGKDLKSMGLSDKEIVKLLKNNKLRDKDFKKLLKKLEKRSGIDASKLDKLSHRIASGKYSANELDSKIQDDHIALKHAYKKELYSQERYVRKMREEEKTNKKNEKFVRGNILQSKIEYLKYKASGGLLGEEWHAALPGDELGRSFTEQQRDIVADSRLNKINLELAKATSSSDARGELLTEKRMIEFEKKMKQEHGSNTKLASMDKKERNVILAKIESDRTKMIKEEYSDARKEQEKGVKDLKVKMREIGGGKLSESQISKIIDERETRIRYQDSDRAELEKIVGRELSNDDAQRLYYLARDLDGAKKELLILRHQESEIMDMSRKYMDKMQGKELMGDIQDHMPDSMKKELAIDVDEERRAKLVAIRDLKTLERKEAQHAEMQDAHEIKIAKQLNELNALDEKYNKELDNLSSKMDKLQKEASEHKINGDDTKHQEILDEMRGIEDSIHKINNSLDQEDLAFVKELEADSKPIKDLENELFALQESLGVKADEFGYSPVENEVSAAERLEEDKRRSEFEIDQMERQVDAQLHFIDNLNESFEQTRKELEASALEQEKKDEIIAIEQEKYNAAMEEGRKHLDELMEEQENLASHKKYLEQQQEEAIKDPISELLSSGSEVDKLLANKSEVDEFLKGGDNALIKDEGDAISQLAQKDEDAKETLGGLEEKMQQKEAMDKVREDLDNMKEMMSDIQSAKHAQEASKMAKEADEKQQAKLKVKELKEEQKKKMKAQERLARKEAAKKASTKKKK